MANKRSYCNNEKTYVTTEVNYKKSKKRMENRIKQMNAPLEQISSMQNQIISDILKEELGSYKMPVATQAVKEVRQQLESDFKSVAKSNASNTVRKSLVQRLLGL